MLEHLHTCGVAAVSDRILQHILVRRGNIGQARADGEAVLTAYFGQNHRNGVIRPVLIQDIQTVQPVILGFQHNSFAFLDRVAGRSGNGLPQRT
ncbi:hypothetical protein D3C71_1864100 [compost metagenome]